MKKLTAKEVFTREAYDGLTAEERRSALKVEQAKECSGWRAYPDTCAELVDFIPDDWWSKPCPAYRRGYVSAQIRY